MLPKIILGLGNPGRRYARTRHNMGFWVVDVLGDQLEASWKTSQKAAVAHVRHGSDSLILAEPLTFMNLSGEAAAPLVSYYRLTPRELLVICDDVNLPVGKIRIRMQGSAGGHHGLESIIQAIGSPEFPRLRLGVKPLEGDLPVDLSGFVLEKFARGEEAVASESVRRAVSAVFTILDEGYEKAMSSFNREPEPAEPS